MLKITDEAYIRMVAERAELQQKVDKLDSFIKQATKGEVKNITTDDIGLLKEQLHYMNGYLRILGFRIQRVYESAQ